MPKRKKPGRKPSGLTVTKTFKVTPKTSRDLLKIAENFDSEAHVIRAALDQFFLTYAVRQTDNDVQSIGPSTELAAA